MGKVSAVFYSIANIFNWIIFIIALAGGIVSVLVMTGVVNWDWAQNFGWVSLVPCIIICIVCWVTIWMVNRAKKEGTSKAWDVLFIILGLVETNIFYILGGIFGLLARNKAD